MFETKPQIALDQFGRPRRQRRPEASCWPMPVMARHGFRDRLTELGLTMWSACQASTASGRPGTEPLPAKPWYAGGTAAQLLRATRAIKPVRSGSRQGLPRKAWKTVRWREGTGGALISRFAAVRVRPSHRDTWRADAAEEWLLIEWPKRDESPGQILAFDAASEHAARRPCRYRQAALAHRARLSGFEAGTWARPLRRSRLARVPPSRQPVHRRLRISSQ